LIAQSKIQVDWSILSHFEPIDIRESEGGVVNLVDCADATPGDETIISRILSRFHRSVLFLVCLAHTMLGYGATIMMILHTLPMFLRAVLFMD
jgi:hypothetical protein